MYQSRELKSPENRISENTFTYTRSWVRYPWQLGITTCVQKVSIWWQWFRYTHWWSQVHSLVPDWHRMFLHEPEYYLHDKGFSVHCLGVLQVSTLESAIESKSKISYTALPLSNTTVSSLLCYFPIYIVNRSNVASHIVMPITLVRKSSKGTAWFSCSFPPFIISSGPPRVPPCACITSGAR